jgi:hypothetical protein
VLAGCLLLLAGLAVTFAAIATATAAAFLAGTAVAGAGFGLALLGVNRILIALAAPAQHAGLIAAIFTINFLGLSIPVLIAGVATAHAGLHLTALTYCVAIAVLLTVAAGSLMPRRRGPATGQGTSQAGPGPAAAIARGRTGRAGRPQRDGSLPGPPARVECQARSARTRDTAGSYQRRRHRSSPHGVDNLYSPHEQKRRGRGIK